MAERLWELIQGHLEATDVRPGKVHQMDVRHESDCRRPQGGPCTCEPDVISRSDPKGKP